MKIKEWFKGAEIEDIYTIVGIMMWVVILFFIF